MADSTIKVRSTRSLHRRAQQWDVFDGDRFLGSVVRGYTGSGFSTVQRGTPEGVKVRTFEKRGVAVAFITEQR